jgi:hypothetical protein
LEPWLMQMATSLIFCLLKWFLSTYGLVDFKTIVVISIFFVSVAWRLPKWHETNSSYMKNFLWNKYLCYCGNNFFFIPKQLFWKSDVQERQNFATPARPWFSKPIN